MRILVVEDDPGANEFYGRILSPQGYDVEFAITGPEGEDRGLERPFDVIVLDLRLPGRSGFEVCTNLRARGVSTPIIMVSGLDAVYDKTLGLDCGADDYLTKPFAVDELLARLRALTRRHTNGGALRIADLELDRKRMKVRRGNLEIELSYREFSLLAFLMSREGQAVSRAEIAEHVWGNKPGFNSNVIDVTVCHLRGKIEVGGGSRLIHGVRGIGYVLDSRVDSQKEDPEA